MAKKNSLANRKKLHAADIAKEKRETEKIEAKRAKRLQKRKAEDEKIAKQGMVYDEVEDEGNRRGKKKMRRETMDE